MVAPAGSEAVLAAGTPKENVGAAAGLAPEVAGLVMSAAVGGVEEAGLLGVGRGWKVGRG